MKKSRVVLYDFVPYGAPELLEVGEPYLTRAMTTAMLGLVAAFALGLCLTTWIGAHPGERIIELPGPGHFMQPVPLPEPPTLLPRAFEPTVTPTRGGQPVPVPDIQVTQDVPFPTQDALRQGAPAGATATGGEIAPPAIDPTPGPDEYVYYEDAPAVAKSVLPVYPDIAREAGVDGMVTLRVLVGRDGRVKDVLVTRSVPMLDEAAIAAVRQWVFTPALSSGRPVAVWVAVPVRFSLH